jgi:formylmethanofuran dehydrogenase subunit E
MSGEPFMEPRGRLRQGKTLCLACFEKLERGIEYR